MARTLTCLYGKTGFPGVEEPSGPWYSIFRRWNNIQVSSVSTAYHCSWIRKSLFMVSCSINRQNIDLPLWRNRFSRCWWTLRSL